MNPYHYTQFHFLTLSSENPKYQLIAGGRGVVTQSGCFPIMEEHCVKRDEI